MKSWLYFKSCQSWATAKLWEESKNFHNQSHVLSSKLHHLWRLFICMLWAVYLLIWKHTLCQSILEMFMLELYHTFGTTFNFNVFMFSVCCFGENWNYGQLSKLKMTQFYVENKCIFLMSDKYFWYNLRYCYLSYFSL